MKIRKTDIGVGVYLLAALVFLIIPLPNTVLDVMLAFNIGIALIILFDALFIKEVLDTRQFQPVLRIDVGAVQAERLDNVHLAKCPVLLYILQ